jgi:hypothetical protein
LSLEATKAVWQHSRARGTARLILLALADHADEAGVAWPSLSRLAEYANVTKPNVCRNISCLIEMGELCRVGTVPSKQGKPGTKYKILMVRVRTVKEAKWCGAGSLNGAEAHHEPSLNHHSSILKGETSFSSEVVTALKPDAVGKRNQKIMDEKNFSDFWQQYPKRVGKGAARKSYLKAVQKVSHAKIMEGLSRYSPDPNFTCNPSTWLNQERWDDEQYIDGTANRTNRHGSGGGSSHREGIVEASERFLARRGLSTNVWELPD